GLDGRGGLNGGGYRSREFGQSGILYQGCGREVEQPGCDDRATPPDLRNVGQIEIILIMLRVAQRRRFSVNYAGRLADIGRLEDRHALGVGRHHAVFDAVVHHLDEVTAAARPAMQVALLGRSAALFPPRRARDVAAAWRERLEDRVEVLHHGGLAADHHAVAALQAPDATAGADVDIVDALGRQLLGSADVVDVVGVATVD